MEAQSESDHPQTDVVALPAPTAWPMVLALGLSLVVAGIMTNVAISLLGLLLTLRAGVGWFRQVLPVECHESVAVQVQPTPAVSARPSAERLPVDPMHRKMLPIETYKITAGIKGGIAGGVAMAVPAMLFGLIKYHSVWYAINLLLMSAVPPLILLGWPVVPLLRGLPSWILRPVLGPLLRLPVLRRFGRWFISPLVAWTAMNLVFLGDTSIGTSSNTSVSWRVRSPSGGA